jgi:hypothetical protein
VWFVSANGFGRRPSGQERRKAGKALRAEASRSSHAKWKPPSARPGPISIRTKMAALAGTDHLQQWYERIDVDQVLELLHGTERRAAERIVRKARRHTHAGALEKLTEVIDGRLVAADAG